MSQLPHKHLLFRNFNAAEDLKLYSVKMSTNNIYSILHVTHVKDYVENVVEMSY